VPAHALRLSEWLSPKIAAQKRTAGCRNPCAFQLRDGPFDVESIVEYTPHMETVQIVLDKKLLRATDQAARRTNRNRSALVRDALREHLHTLAIREKEELDRQGYSRKPQSKDHLIWEAEAMWPDE
jgi:hypothetical protein